MKHFKSIVNTAKFVVFNIEKALFYGLKKGKLKERFRLHPFMGSSLTNWVQKSRD